MARHSSKCSKTIQEEVFEVSYTERYDVSYPREEKDGKTRWIRIGSAFMRSNGSISLLIDSIPIEWDGTAVLFKSKDSRKEPTQTPNDTERYRKRGKYTETSSEPIISDDDIPF